MNESSEPAGVAVDRNVGRDIAAELRGACVGHPAATIPWPHRLLHDAAAELDRLRAENEALRAALQAADHRVVYGVWASGYSYDIFQRALGRLPPTAP